MKLYCFLLIIILLCLLYDNNLYEGNDELYDTSEDRIVQYDDSPPVVDTSFLHYLTSLTGAIGFNLEDYIDMPQAPDERINDCPKPVDCAAEIVNIPLTKDEWQYENSKPTTPAKLKCMKCLACKDKGTFSDDFYAFICDAYAGCYNTPGDSSTDVMPYFYAYDNIDWNNETCPDASKQPIANKTCQFMKNNTSSLDLLSYSNKAGVIKCNANIALLNTSGVGEVVQFFE